MTDNDNDSHNQENTCPLVVDMDGTLLKTDLMVEALFSLLRHHPLCFFLVPFWLLRGPLYFKQHLAERVTVDAAILPYHPTLLAYLRAEHDRGR